MAFMKMNYRKQFLITATSSRGTTRFPFGVSRNDIDRAIEICNSSRPERVCFDDWMVLIFILSKVGIVDLQNREDDCRNLVHRDRWYYRTDHEGRINYLSLFGKVGCPFDLPPEIGYLECLEYLRLKRCRSIPGRELSSLPHLEVLSFDKCNFQFLLHQDDVEHNTKNSFLSRIKLINLKTLRIERSKIPASSSIVSLLAGELPELQKLYLCDIDCHSMKNVLEALTNLDVSFQDSLSHFALIDCCLEHHNLETIFMDILGKFLKIVHLDICNSEVQSIHSLVEGLKRERRNGASNPEQSTLRHLGLTYTSAKNEIFVNDGREKDAIVYLLRTFKTISDVALGAIQFDQDIEYEILANKAGRSLVECGNNRPLLLSGWPAVLERVTRNRKINYNSIEKPVRPVTGLYYLLRFGPVLMSAANW
ncbi:unnamed protein product [Pseudo-nitzschia multistriata]|uniref:Uncharacterized protein n=1 Tax=Pseudo-nitzschia multistriata TaxID=183589 RepID=A0A448Z6G1_9STRA|nr:unnamed protein product [Pseudo-nitzschia multistriata]